jgi:radical SAM superfamily enzyme YgiQ (UPF0313 family)
MMDYFMAIDYDEPLFRPPSEAYSLIFQVTYGCSWNKCTFCEMYTKKQFRTRKFEEIEAEIKAVAKIDNSLKKIFLADGNAMVLSFSRLKEILVSIKEHFPKVRRISSYALPQDIQSKTDEELSELHKLGLDLLYVGIESGDDQVLKFINKSETAESTIEGLKRARKAGIKLSVMIINGMGGKELSEDHALNSAKVINAVQPEYLSTLVLSYPYGFEHFQSRAGGDFEPLEQKELFQELHTMIGNLELESTIYRSDHASNYLTLRGVLPKDKEKLLGKLDAAMSDSPDVYLRPEKYRGL